MKIVTISRQVGSLGDEIAAVTAEKMGLELVGRTGLHELAQSCDPEYKDACELYETEHGLGFFERLFFDRPSYTSLFEALTYEQAAKGNVLIVGRGAQVVLCGVPEVFRARLVAPIAARIERVMKRTASSREEAEEFVRKYDTERKSLMRTVFKEDLDDWSLYDLILNTGHYSVEAAADVIVEAAGKMTRERGRDDLKEWFTSLALAKRIEALVRKKLTSAVAQNVYVSADSGGVITISGRIAEPRQKERADKLAKEYPGVTKVVNELKVTQLSFGL
jgi:cytidylate kinase